MNEPLNLSRVRRAMRIRFWRQVDLARAARLSEGTVSIALGGGACSPRTAGRLARVLDLTPSQILRPEAPSGRRRKKTA